MRASNDFFVVGMAGIGTALFLTQLLIVSQQIVAARNRVQADLDAEKSAVPVDLINTIRRPPLIEHFHSTSLYSLSSGWRRCIHNRRGSIIGGFVDFDLAINPDGSVARWKVVDEFPQGYGFAAAAAKVMPKWRFQPTGNPSRSGTTVRRLRVTYKPIH